MKNMKKIMPLAASIAIILIAGIFASAGTMAQFNDTETVGVHDIQAGTLDLTLEGSDVVVHVTIKDIYPGWSKTWLWELKNTGSLAGNLTVEITNVVNKENGRNDPEREAGDVYGDGGELGQFLRVKKFDMRSGPGTSPWCLTDIYDHTFIPEGGHTLDECGGRTFSSYWPHDIGHCTLESGETQYCFLHLELPSDVGNIVQSDSVEFDIIFHLDQLTP